MRGITKTVATGALGLVTAVAPIVSTPASAHAAPSAHAAVSAQAAVNVHAAGPTYHRVTGTPGNDRLHGTARRDLIGGSAGRDIIRPDHGEDIVRAAGGDDRIFVFNDGDVDRIHCGDGFDVVYYHYSVDQHDILDDNCEGAVA